MLILDTQTLVWLLAGEPRLGQRARSAIAAETGSVGYATPSLYEVGVLHRRGRIGLDGTLAEWRQGALQLGLREHPLLAEHAMLATELDGLPLDPFDRFIVAISIGHSATLVTSDEAILRWPGTGDRLDARK